MDKIIQGLMLPFSKAGKMHFKIFAKMYGEKVVIDTVQDRLTAKIIIDSLQKLGKYAGMRFVRGENA